MIEEIIQCACVSHDAAECAFKLDGLDRDDPHYELRRCDCVCHNEDREEDDSD